MQQSEVNRSIPYFRDQFRYNVDQLQRAEIQNRAQEQREKSRSQKIERQYTGLQRYIIEYAYNTDIHGVQFLLERRSLCEKIFWILVVILSMAACLYFVIVALIVFRSSTIIVSFRRQALSIYEIPFPAVTVCPETKSFEKMLTQNEINQLLHETANISVDYEQWLKYQYFYTMCPRVKEALFVGSPPLLNDFLKTFYTAKIDLDEMMLSCELFGQRRNCSDLFFPTLTDQGACYTFNMLSREAIFTDDVYLHRDFYKNRKTSGWAGSYLRSAPKLEVNSYPHRALLAGADNALRIILKHSSKTVHCLGWIHGIKIMLHIPQDVPLLYRQLMVVPRNKYVQVALEPNFLGINNKVREMPLDDRECYLNHEKDLKYFKTYTQSNCFLECTANFFLKKCGCVLYYMPRKQDTEICGIEKMLCLKKIQKEWLVGNIKATTKRGMAGYCDCKPLCSDLNYLWETSQNAWAWKKYYSQQWNSLAEKENKKIDPGRDAISLLSIYFKAPDFLATRRYEWHGISDLLSQIGGFFSFYTGMSFVTIIEVIYFLTIRVFFNRMNKVYHTVQQRRASVAFR